MVVNPLPFAVTFDPLTAPLDITGNITAINSCKFQGSGRIRTASIMLNAEEGAFITNDNGGLTPQVNQFDQFRITWQDENENEKTGIFEVDTELGQQTENSNLLPLELKGRERALQDIKFPAYFEWVTPFTALALLIISYNANKGSDQPDILIGFPATNTFLGSNNIYEFNAETTYYDAIVQIFDRLNQPTTGGGLGNFFSFIFEDQGANLVMTIKEQGTGGSGVLNPIDNPVHSLSYRIESQNGTQVFVRGQANAGSVPNNFHLFSSFVEEINNYPAYNTLAVYSAGMRIIDAGTIFEANQTVPTGTPPPSAEWTATDFATIVGNIEYSEFTNSKSIQTKNSCSNPTNAFLGAGFDSPAFPDGNLVVRESFYIRDWVFGRSLTDDIESDPDLKFYLRGQLNTGLYAGFRLLVDTSLGNPSGAFGDGAGTIFSDRFGRTFENALVQYTGTEWIVFMEPVTPTIQDRGISHCCVHFEGKVYEYNTDPTAQGKQKLAIRKADVFRGGLSTGPFSWQDISDDSSGNDPYHHPKNIANVDGLITDTIASNQDISTYLTNSAIQITYEYNLDSIIDAFLVRTGNWLDSAIDNAFRLFSEPIEDTVQPTTAELAALVQTDYYDFGWWYALPFPYPFSEFNAISEQVGDLYGLGTDPNGVNNILFGHLDIQNSTFTRNGLFGLNNDQASDLGDPFTALAFLFNFTMLAGGNTKPFEGDITFTVTIYDDLSQVWRTDYNYRHLGDTQDIILPFTNFTVERPSRAPWDIDTIVTNLIHTPELEIRSIFQERKVRMITWQLKSSYDKHERYLPFNTDNFFTNLVFGALDLFETIGIIDGLRLVKQPFVSSGVELTRVLNSNTYQAPQTRNLRQLQSIAFAEQQRQSLQFETYTYETDIRCDLQTEQFLFVENQDMVKFTEMPASDLDAWVTATPYDVQASVQNGATGFRCFVAHTSETDNEPGVGVDYLDFWIATGDPVANTRELVVMSENFMYNAEGKRGGAIMEINLGKRLDVS